MPVESQATGRVHSYCRIQDRCPGDDQKVAEQLLYLRPLVGDTGNRAELASREGRRDGNLSNRRRLAARGQADRAIWPPNGAAIV